MTIPNSDTTLENGSAIQHDPLAVKLMILCVSLCGLSTFAFGLARDAINAEWLALAIGALVMALAVLIHWSNLVSILLTVLASVGLLVFFASQIVQASPSIALVTLVIATWTARTWAGLRICLDKPTEQSIEIKFAHVVILVSVSALLLALARWTSTNFLEFTVLRPTLLSLGLLLSGLALLTNWNIWQRIGVALALFLPVGLAIVQGQLDELSSATYYVSDLAVAFGWCLSVFGLAKAIGFSLTVASKESCYESSGT